MFPALWDGAWRAGWKLTGWNVAPLTVALTLVPDDHRSQQSTAIYARLNLDPVRASVNKATDAMFAYLEPQEQE
jgi:hypothetical protein